MEDFFINLISWVIVIGGFALYITSKNQKKATIQNLYYDEKTHELTLKKRDYTNKKVLRVEEIWNHSINYEPEKLVYTGATVGGVHTGGVHKEGGYNYYSGTSTGQYQVYYDNGDRYDTYTNRTLGGVEKVKLTNSQMIAQARANGFISKYLQGDTLVLGYRTGSKSDCKKIVAWLCGES